MRWTLENAIRLVVGILLWVALVAGVRNTLVTVENSMPVGRIVHHFNKNHLRVVVNIPPLDHRKEPKVSDPIKCSLHPDDPSLLTQIGEVEEVEHLGKKVGYNVTLLIWEEYKHLATLDTTFAIFGGPTGFEEIVATLFDDHAKEELRQRWAIFVAENKTELKRTISPILESTLNELMAVVLPSIEESFNAHQEEIWTLLRAHWEADVKGALLPLLKEKANPRINSEIIPLFMDCVQELWEKAPAGSFAWNAFRDKVVPWDTKDNLRKRFIIWLDDEGKDVIDAHLPGVMAKCEEIGEDLLADQEVKDALAGLAKKVFSNPQIKALGETIIREAILDNPKTGAFFEAKLKSPEFQQAVEKLGRIVEPHVRDMIDSVILDPRSTEKKINPNLVRVMRAQILWKKDFWLLMEPGTDALAWNDYSYPKTAIQYGFK